MKISLVLAVYNKLDLTTECYKRLRQLYQNAPFINSPYKRPALPNDKCRNCTVGYCSGDSCGSELNMYGPEYGAYFN